MKTQNIPASTPPAFLLCLLCLTGLAARPDAGSPATDAEIPAGCTALSLATNAVRVLLFTNGFPGGGFGLNTFEIRAYGEPLLSRPGLATGNFPPRHHILVNGAGPNPGPGEGMTLVSEASGPEWRATTWDVTAAYRDRVEQYQRTVVCVEPDLVVFYDRVRAKEPVQFQMHLYPPASTVLDPVWGDLRLDLHDAGFRIHAPGAKKSLRPWRRTPTDGGDERGQLVLMELGPTNRLATVDLITVLGVFPGGGDPGYQFKLLNSETAVGTRILRHGLPTLVAFRLDPAAAKASLTGLEFSGPVGVGIFKPKRPSKGR